MSLSTERIGCGQTAARSVSKGEEVDVGNAAHSHLRSSAAPGSQVLTEESMLTAAVAYRRLQNAYEVSMPHSSLSWLLRRAIPQLDR
jgi:hypothetical protein